jgi:hypothetical protein
MRAKHLIGETEDKKQQLEPVIASPLQATYALEHVQYQLSKFKFIMHSGKVRHASDGMLRKTCLIPLPTARAICDYVALQMSKPYRSRH